MSGAAKTKPRAYHPPHPRLPLRVQLCNAFQAWWDKAQAYLLHEKHRGHDINRNRKKASGKKNTVLDIKPMISTQHASFKIAHLSRISSHTSGSQIHAQATKNPRWKMQTKRNKLRVRFCTTPYETTSFLFVAVDGSGRYRRHNMFDATRQASGQDLRINT